MVHAKHYQDINNIFYMTYDQITKISHIKNTKTISNCITDLHELGFIKIVSRNKWSEVKNKKKPNKYKITIEDKQIQSNKAFAICDKEELCKNCMYQMFSYFYDDKELKKVVTRSVRTRNLKINLECTKNIFE